jgi:oligoribonuclease NrnB/cAMP/cGMP phosphodiesterase (DHH superfamily)
MAHKASQLFDDSLFDGDENAIVDFKYSPHPKLTWWFDHHQSAFLSPQDAEHFLQDRSGKKMYDPTYRSCTKFIATFARERYGYEPADLKELVHWADIIDGAQYASAEAAVKLGAPAMQLVLVIEAAKGSSAVHRIIRMMRSQTLEEIIHDAEVQELYKPLYERHLKSIEIIGRESHLDKGVLFFDLIEDGTEGYNKFIPYYLFPDSVYTVSVSKSSFRTKVSVGSNPWAGQELKHNLATICERYGGGGHPKVGAISFEIGAIEQARQAAREIVAELQT